MRYLVTVDPGLEQVAADELRQLDPSAAVRVDGRARLVVEATDGAWLFRARTIHHVARLAVEARAGTLDELRAAIAGTALPELERAASFRVSANTTGPVSFPRRELAGAAGAVLQRRYGTRVDLERFEVNVRIDLDGERLLCGVQLTRESLGGRIHRGEPLRTSLKPTVAAAMLRLAGAHSGSGRLIDPMCGAATIPIEAASINPRLSISAADWDGPTVALARRALAGQGIALEIDRADARLLGRDRPRAFDYIVTDPPYGVRLAKRTSLTRLYGALLPSFERALAERGRIVMIVVKYRTFLAALATTALEIVDRHAVELGGLEPQIVVLRHPGPAVAD
ncbi:MAG TPA: THUMP domain-containing protein [Candidatus Polarisedimenticolaceae bacterium]|nr:THUMP domain-containing protein [Candidatus Polarisedimenticolaceae bacterium]